MEHLHVPPSPYGCIKVPFLGEMYDAGIADLRVYPLKKGWDLENDRAAMENYRHLGETYRDIGLLHAKEVLRDLLSTPVATNIEQRVILEYSVSVLNELLASTEGSSGPIGPPACLNTGADILDEAIRQAREPQMTREHLVEAMRKRRLLDLLAVFTNDKFRDNKAAFARRRQ